MAFPRGLGALLVLLATVDVRPTAAVSRQRRLTSGSPPPPAGFPLDEELAFFTEDVQRRKFSAGDFLLQFTAPAAGGNTRGSIVGQAVGQRPALATLPGEGAAQTVVTLGPCAMNQPHVHPRATEFAFVVRGDNVAIGFAEENFNARSQSGGRVLTQPTPAGSTFVVPQGLLHFVINRGCSEAQVLASFPTKDPGTQTVLPSLFSAGMPDDVLRAATGLDDHQIQSLREKIAQNANPSADAQCLKSCGLQ